MFDRILVALDHSDTSKDVFKRALELAKATGGSLLLMHVLNPTDSNYPDAAVYPAIDVYYPVLYNELLKRWQEELAGYEQHELEKLRSLAAEARDVGVTVEFTQNIGDPGRAICAVARTWRADLIVIGRRGRSGVSELVLGSVSSYVMHHAPCSVLTVQGQTQPQSVSEQTAATAAP
jgi:nucleotide-binding universal stress UspA family protein